MVCRVLTVYGDSDTRTAVIVVPPKDIAQGTEKRQGTKGLQQHDTTERHIQHGSCCTNEAESKHHRRCPPPVSVIGSGGTITVPYEVSRFPKADEAGNTKETDTKKKNINASGTAVLGSPHTHTPHGASRLVQAMSAWLVKTRRAPSRHSRHARVYGHTTTAVHKLSTPPSPPLQKKKSF